MKIKKIILAVTMIALYSMSGFADDPQSNLRSGISLFIDGISGQDFVEEYLYHDLEIDDHKIIYLKSSVPIRLEHNERNILAPEQRWLDQMGLTGPDGVPSTGDEHIIGKDGQDGIPDSGDEGVIGFRIDRFEQFHGYRSIDRNINFGYENPFTFDELEYEVDIPVVGTVGSNDGPYGQRPYKTNARYQRGMLSPCGEEVHVITYWDIDEDVLPSNFNGRGHLSDGNMVYCVINPQVPAMRIRASSGGEYYTTPLTSYHTPRILEQTTYCSGNVTVELVNITNGLPVFYRFDQGSAVEYTGPIPVRDAGSGDNVLSFWIENGTVKKRRFIIDPPYPSKGEKHGCMLWNSEAELAYIKNKMGREPYATGLRNFQRNLSNRFDTIKMPFPTRTGWRGIIAQAYVPFHFMVPYYLGELSMGQNSEYAILSKKTLLSLVNVDFIGSEDIEDDYRPCTDIYSIPNSGHNTYINLGLGYDLTINIFKKTNHTQGITPIEDYKIRDQLAKIVHIMLKYRENKNTRKETWIGWNGQVAGNMHWGHGEELIAYVLGMAMPSYSSPVYGTSGFDGSSGEYVWTPYPDQKLSWYEILTNPDIPTPGHPNVRSAARYNYILGSFNQLLEYPRDTTAIWDLPTDGIFWHGANCLMGATKVYESGEIDPQNLEETDILRLKDDDEEEYPAHYTACSLEGRKLYKTAWNRSFHLQHCAGPKGGLFHVETSGYENAFVDTTVLVYYLHKRRYGAGISPMIEGYLETKYNRISENYDPYFLKQKRTSGHVYTIVNGEYQYPVLDNGRMLAGCMSCLLYNPAMPGRVKDAMRVLKQLGEEYESVFLKKFYSNPLGLILYEDDENLYTTIEPEPQDPEPDPESEPEPEPKPETAIIPEQTDLIIYNNVLISGTNNHVLIHCYMHVPAHLRVAVYGTDGKEKLILFDEPRDAGIHEIFWDGSDAQGTRIGSGIYFIRMNAGDFTEIKKIAVVK
ncbi:MAG: hypothetical protein GF384_01050 [Elusimicrobia bacterium]|nr:hypothetical protein [Elusimicrobiota bacterium]